MFIPWQKKEKLAKKTDFKEDVTVDKIKYEMWHNISICMF